MRITKAEPILTGGDVFVRIVGYGGAAAPQPGRHWRASTRLYATNP